MKTIPFEFVLEALARVHPRTRPMFGYLGVYVGEKIVIMLRKRADGREDNGVWIATVPGHCASLKKELPSLRSIRLFGSTLTVWQNIPNDAEDFEESAIKACELILRRDPRIGKVPKPKAKKKRPS